MPGGEIGRDIRVNRELMPQVDLDAEAPRGRLHEGTAGLRLVDARDELRRIQLHRWFRT